MTASTRKRQNVVVMSRTPQKIKGGRGAWGVDVFVDGYMERWTIEKIKRAVADGDNVTERNNNK